MFIYLMSITADEHQHILWFIYENYRGDMFRMARSVMRDDHLAEDVVQASFERIIEKMHLIEKIPSAGLRRYIVLIVKSIAINTIAKEHKYKLELDSDMESMAGMDDFNLENMVVQNEQVNTIRQCLKEMDEKYVHSMIFRYYYGFSDSETAELLGIGSASTVRSLCHRGRKIITKAMLKAGETHESVQG
jgi:RNA polymerase sigma-70 factor (ECF subfamily)